MELFVDIINAVSAAVMALVAIFSATKSNTSPFFKKSNGYNKSL